MEARLDFRWFPHAIEFAVSKLCWELSTRECRVRLILRHCINHLDTQRFVATLLDFSLVSAAKMLTHSSNADDVVNLEKKILKLKHSGQVSIELQTGNVLSMNKLQ